jgi:hypothetical protein
MLLYLLKNSTKSPFWATIIHILKAKNDFRTNSIAIHSKLSFYL